MENQDHQDFDIVLYGATSFVGEITAKYLFAQYGVDGIRWAIAGRSQAKLDSVREALGAGAKDLPAIIANSDDEQSLAAMAKTTKVIISTVGPYAYYGEALVKVCSELGTHYCDLTGEVQWIKAMLDKYEDTAKESGAMITHCCGFDSIPSDMGVHFLQQQAKAQFGETCSTVNMYVKAAKGGFSGGTVESLTNVVKLARKDPKLRKQLINPYLICPENHPFTVRQETAGSGYDEQADLWWGPFVMAGINTRVVHRTNALLNNEYGTEFRYKEATATGRGSKGKRGAKLMALGMGAFTGMLAIGPTRFVLQKFFLPDPGEGPSEQEQQEGYYDLRLYGTTDSGKTITVKVTGDQDPGYGSTAKMLSEAAACLAFDLDAKGGFWTPASLMGNKLRERLVKDAGLTFAVID